MIKERCYFMGGTADGCIIPISPHIREVSIPVAIRTSPYFVVEDTDLLRPPPSRFNINRYYRTRLTHLATHPLHGEWPLTVYALTQVT